MALKIGNGGINNIPLDVRREKGGLIVERNTHFTLPLAEGLMGLSGTQLQLTIIKERFHEIKTPLTIIHAQVNSQISNKLDKPPEKLSELRDLVKDVVEKVGGRVECHNLTQEELQRIANIMMKSTERIEKIVNEYEPETDKDKKWKNIILSKCERIKEGIKELTQIREETSIFNLTNINELVKKALLSSDGLLVDMELDMLLRETPKIYANGEGIITALNNLLINAVQAMERNDGREKIIRVETGRVDGRAYMEVSDTGCGMTEKQISKILSGVPFTTKERGSGIGMPTVLKIVKEHGGSLEITSEVEKGSTFKIFLPINEGHVYEKS